MAEPISLGESILRAEQRRIDNMIRKTSGWTPTFLDEDGASFTQPSTNLLQASGLIVRRGALSLGEAAYIPGVGSVAEMIARVGVDTTDDNLPPFEMSGGRIVLDGGETVAPEEATGQQMYNALDPVVRQILEQNGYSESNFKDADFETFKERYNNASHFIRVNDRLDRYQHQRPALYWVAHAGAFGANALTDPITYLSFGAAKGVKTVGTALAKSSVKAGAKEAVESKVRQSVIRLAAEMKVNRLDIAQALARLGTDGNKIAAYSLYAGLGGFAGFSQDLLNQYFEHEERLDQGFEEAFGYDPMRGAVSTLVGAAFASWGGLLMNKGVIVPTNKAVAALNDTTLNGRVMKSLLRRGTIQEDAVADLRAISGWDRVQAYLDGVYSEEDASIVQLYLDDWMASADPKRTEQEVRDFMLSIPTPNELIRYLKGEDVDTIVGSAMRDLSSINETIRTLRSKGSTGKELEEALLKRDMILAGLADTKTAFKFKKTPVSRSASGVQLNEEAAKASSAVETIMQTMEPLTIYSKEKARKAFTDGLLARKAEEAVGGQMSTNDRGLIRKYLFDTTDVLGGAFTPSGTGRALTKTGNWLDLQIAKMIAAVDMHGSDAYIAREFGEAVPSLHWRSSLDAAHRRSLSRKILPILRKYKGDEAALENVQRTALRLAGGESIPNASEDAKHLARMLRQFYDNRGSRGVASGSLKDLLTNYVHIRLVKHPANMEGSGLIQELGQRYARYLYNKHYSGDDLHLGTLADMGIITRDGEFKAGRGLESVPRKRSELTPELLEEYNARLHRQLEIEAELSFKRRLNRRTSDKYDPAITGDDTPYIYREQSAAARKIEQEFYLSDEVAELGIVDYDILNNMRAYDNSFGAKIRTTELLKDIFGAPVRWEDVMQALRSRVDSDSSHPNYNARQRGLQRLQAAYDMATQHGYRTDTDPMAGVHDALVAWRAAITNSRVVLSMAPEQIGLITRGLFRPWEIRTMVRDMISLYGKTRKADIEDFALTHMYEDEVSRFFGDALNEMQPSDSTLGRSINATKKTAAFVRKIFLEQFVTEQNRRVAFNMLFSDAFRRITKNPERASVLGGDFTDVKAFRKAAREAGFGGDVDTARLLRMSGIAKPEVVEGLVLLKQKSRGRNARAVLSAIAEETDRPTQVKMRAAYDALFRFARQKTDEVIVTPTPSTRLDLTKTPGFLKPHVQFLSYRVAWFNSFLFRAGSEPFALGAGLLGASALGEALNMIHYDILYGGRSPEEVMEEWKEKPIQKMAEAVARVPIGGAFSDAWGMALSIFTGSRTAQPSAIPAKSMVENFVNSTSGNIRSYINGEGDPQKTMTDLSKINPMQGWYFQIFSRGLRGFESEE